MARTRRKVTNLEDIPGLFDGLEVDLTRPDLVGGLIERHRAEAELLARERAGLPWTSGPADRYVPRRESATERLMFISFGSGSSGNCSYLGNNSEGILIDAGVDPVEVKDAMRRNGLDYKNIRGLLITHDHRDHVRYAYSFLRKQDRMLMYATPRTLSGMLRRHSISPRIKDYHRPIYKEHPFEIGNMQITAFETSHDGTDNVGFHISFGPEHRFVVMTDTGVVTERGEYYASQASYLMMESNYDAEMLESGTYPEYLKARIRSEHGHMDNAETARFLARIYMPKLSYIFLCHLSHDNNKPELALGAVRDALAGDGVTVGDGSGSLESRDCKVQLAALPRFEASPLYVFRESGREEKEP